MMIGPAGATTAPSLPHVTVIGDSVLTAVEANPEPRAIMTHGFETTVDVAACRRVTGTNCPFGGIEAPNVVDVIRSLGPKVGPIVLIEVGYNDYADTFAQSVEDAIKAALSAGATHILWANMSERREGYIPMNGALAAAASRHKELTVIDWNAYSRDHDEWFQGDGVHLFYAGAVGMATLFHASLEALLPPLLAVGTLLPAARVGRPFATQLIATGGTTPYHWRLTSSPLPRGLHLLADGRLTGIPLRPTNLALTFVVTDAREAQATLEVMLVVRASPRAPR